MGAVVRQRLSYAQVIGRINYKWVSARDKRQAQLKEKREWSLKSGQDNEIRQAPCRLSRREMRGCPTPRRVKYLQISKKSEPKSEENGSFRPHSDSHCRIENEKREGTTRPARRREQRRQRLERVGPKSST